MGATRFRAAPSARALSRVRDSLVYNYRPGQLARTRIALANVRAGVADARIACIGDSTTRGTRSGGGTAQFVTGYPVRLAELLAATGLAVSTDNLWGQLASGSLATSDSRVAITGTLGNSGATLGGRLFVQTAASSLTFSGREQSSTLTLTYVQNTSTGTFSWQLDGGTATNVATAGAKAILRVTIPATLGLHNLRINWVSGSVNWLGMEMHDASRTKVRVWNMGWPSSQASGNWNVNSPNAWEPISAIGDPLFRPHCTIIDLGQNDLNATTPVTPAALRAALQSLIAAALVHGDVLLMTPAPSASSWDTANLQAAYRDVYYALADANDLVLIDNHVRTGPFAAALAAGFYDAGAEVHMSAAGYVEKASAAARLLTAL